MQVEGERGCSSLGQTTDGRQGLACRARGLRGEVGGGQRDGWMGGWGEGDGGKRGTW